MIHIQEKNLPFTRTFLKSLETKQELILGFKKTGQNIGKGLSKNHFRILLPIQKIGCMAIFKKLIKSQLSSGHQGEVIYI
jgi:hypothetical protein